MSHEDESRSYAVETHTAVLLFMGPRVLKFKKPIDLGFVNFCDRDARAMACREEVVLNRRLSPDVYIGAAALVDEGGRCLEHAVVMRRLPAERRLSRLLADPGINEMIEEAAAAIAEFHKRCPVPSDAMEIAGPDALRRLWLASLDHLNKMCVARIDRERLDMLRAVAVRYIAEHRDLLRQRVDEGYARDGHGDLLSDDIYCLPDGIRILDCLEFDRRLRIGDIMSDIAFLAMDLEHKGRNDLSERLLDSYQTMLGGPDVNSLMHHYTSYRATVRAKVSGVRAEQLIGESPGSEMSDLLELALRHAFRAEPAVIAISGLPATGKSTIAGMLADELGATLLSSDTIRKDIVGIERKMPAPAPFQQGIYAPGITAEVYRELIAQSKDVLERDRTVVVDGSFASPRWRKELASIARLFGAPFIPVECVAAANVVRARLARRSIPNHASDADRSVYERMCATWTPWDQARKLGTEGSAEESLSALRTLMTRS